MVEETTYLDINKLPFYTGMQNESGLSDLPEYLPFKLIFDNKMELIVQESNLQIDSWVQQAYSLGSSLSTPLGEGSFSQYIARDIISAIEKSLGQKSIAECSFLEVGCGQGYLLYLLKQMGAKSCKGIEPDPRCREGSEKYDIEIIHGFFDSGLVNEEFDVVFSYGVLEHIENPLEFLRELKKCTKEGGLVFSAVPNCEKGLELGDFSLMAHEHYNYFTPRSLTGVYKKAGLTEIQYGNADYGWALYTWGEKNNSINNQVNNPSCSQVSREKQLFERYTERCQAVILSIQEIISSCENEGKSIGVYGAYSHFMIFDWKNPPRFFDGDIAKHGMFLPGSQNAVESPYVLQEKPVDMIFIAPINYDREIRDFIQNELGIRESQLISVKEIYQENDLHDKE